MPISCTNKKIVKAELDRVWEFAQLAENFYDDDGPSVVMEILNDLKMELESTNGI